MIRIHIHIIQISEGYSMHKSRKNKKGFSLVELIIVIAIMVALVAVVAPSFIKYVKKARDVVVTTAAEDVLGFVKAEYGMYLNGNGVIRVGKSKSGSHIDVTFEEGGSLTYKDEEEGLEGESGFAYACGIDSNKSCQSDLVYVIKIESSGISAHPQPIIETETTRIDSDNE